MDRITKEVFKYLQDHNERTARRFAENILSGCVMDEREQIADSAIFNAYQDVVDLEFETIETLYEEDDETTPRQ